MEYAVSASKRKASGFVNIPRSEWRDYLYLWDDGTDPGHEYKDVTSVNIVSDPETGNFGDMGFATFKNGDAIIFNSHGSKIVHDISANEAERMLESGEGIVASKKRHANARELASANGYHLYPSEGEFGWLVLKDETAPVDVDIEIGDDGSTFIISKVHGLNACLQDPYYKACLDEIDDPGISKAIQAAKAFYLITK